MDRARYEELLPRMVDRFAHLRREVLGAIDSLGIGSEVKVSTAVLGQVVLDYFEDVEKLKMFEGMGRVNEAKIYAYQAYWFLRRKPICLADPNSRNKKALFANEMVCISLTIAKALEEAGKAVDLSRVDLREFVNLAYYNFKYRTFTQKSLELMIEALIVGCNS